MASSRLIWLGSCRCVARCILGMGLELGIRFVRYGRQEFNNGRKRLIDYDAFANIPIKRIRTR